MTEIERRKQIFELYTKWKERKLEPFLAAIERAEIKNNAARSKYFAAVDALNRHEANKMFVDRIEREYKKAASALRDAQAEYLSAIDKFNLETYLKEENVGS